MLLNAVWMLSSLHDILTIYFFILCFLFMCLAWLVCVFACVHIHAYVFSWTYSHVLPKSTPFPCPLTLRNPSAPSVLTRCVLCCVFVLYMSISLCRCHSFAFIFILQFWQKFVKNDGENLDIILPEAITAEHILVILSSRFYLLQENTKEWLCGWCGLG